MDSQLIISPQTIYAISVISGIRATFLSISLLLFFISGPLLFFDEKIIKTIVPKTIFGSLITLVIGTLIPNMKTLYLMFLADYITVDNIIMVKEGVKN